MESLICSFYLSVAARKIFCADPSLRYTRMLLGRSATNQQTNILHLLFLLFLSIHSQGTMQPKTCSTSQQHGHDFKGRICPNICASCSTETETEQQTCYFNLSKCTDTGPTSPKIDRTTPGRWQGSHKSANESMVWLCQGRMGSIRQISRSRGGHLPTGTSTGSKVR